MLHTLVAPVLALPLLVLATATVAHAAGTCDGLPATIESSAGTVTGTPGDDVILATPTTPTVSVDALGGNDTICLAAGPASGVATIDAGAGADTVLVTKVGPAAEQVRTELGDGDDSYTSTGTAVSDLVQALSGKDTVTTGPGADSVASGAVGEPNLDALDLGAGSDSATLTLPTGSGAQLSDGPTAEFGDGLRIEGAPGDTAPWDVQLTGTVTRGGAVAATFSNVDTVDVDLGAQATVAVHGTDDDDVVGIDAGTVDVDLGAGRDLLRMGGLSSALPTSGRIDLGGDSDSLELGSTGGIDLDLREGTLGAVDVAGVNTSILTAPRVAYIGTRRADSVYAVGCRVALRGGNGNDFLSFASGDQRSYLPECGHYRFRIFGQGGNDRMTGWRDRDLLDGGRGSDHADGRQDRDLCRAEAKVHCER